MRTARLVLIAVVAAACGGAPSGSSAPSATAAGTAGPPPTAAPTSTPAAAVISFDCAEKLEPVLESLEELDGRLDVGLTYRDYGERVGDISVAYNRLDIDELQATGPTCLASAVLLEEAFNEYVRANSRWSDCVSDTDCTNDSIRSTLQGYWSSASDKIEEARDTFPE